MATSSQWLEGARVRTLPAAVSPVLAGSGIAAFEGAFSLPLALLCMVVALALQVGVNYANDYSDGIRGTDADRVGPMRLVGSGAATPGSVKAAAFASFGVAALAGLGLVLLTQLWWLLAVGVAAIAAAWFYTGGRRPYGYLGLGELFVFVFFGLIAVGGTVLVQVGHTTAATWAAAVAIGALACAILVANNLRDLRGDAAVGKRTLATRLGDLGTRWFFTGLVVVALAGVVVVALLTTRWALLGLLAVILLAGPVRLVLLGGTGRALIKVLKLVGLGELATAAGMALGLLIGG
ncbi:MAG: 1,4-dihydroxy-2-naphthoate polyprenyltransferase [Micropruina sp.]|uniref:1,4-dihydroxy-2-naphthoate polyprenyltransferase n=1 Tax=Micropruina sp. TaxID=2737536 RepID=UPI0039E4A040